MTTQDFITELFCKVHDQMQELPKHSQAHLWPSEVTTIGLLQAIKGIGQPDLLSLVGTKPSGYVP